MKPLLNFKSSTFFAANNISKADAYSAAENSFKTKQHLSGSKLFKLFFGIKNIFIILILLILSISETKAKNCLSFLPFGHNNHYVHLPKNAVFCVKYDEENLNFQTDELGGRIFSKKKNQLQVFGDSQVLGLDIDKNKNHYLYNYINSDFVIYAAPNNGPYEVIKFIYLNKKSISKKIVINFNLSVDIFRVYEDWDIKNYVAVKSSELDEIIKNPYKYKIIITKSLLSNKFFTVSRKNNNEMQKLFMTRNKNKMVDILNLYLKNLEKLSRELEIDFDLVLTMPYWIYKKENGKIIKIKEIENHLKKILCKTFNNSYRTKNIFISKIKNSDQDILTIDKRHLRSDKIVLTNLGKYCSI